MSERIKFIAWVLIISLAAVALVFRVQKVRQIVTGA